MFFVLHPTPKGPCGGFWSPPDAYVLAPHTSGPRDVPRCGALSLLQKDAAIQGGSSRNRCRLNVKMRDLRDCVTACSVVFYCFSSPNPFSNLFKPSRTIKILPRISVPVISNVRVVCVLVANGSLDLAARAIVLQALYSTMPQLALLKSLPCSDR